MALGLRQSMGDGAVKHLIALNVVHAPDQDAKNLVRDARSQCLPVCMGHRSARFAMAANGCATSTCHDHTAGQSFHQTNSDRPTALPYAVGLGERAISTRCGGHITIAVSGRPALQGRE